MGLTKATNKSVYVIEYGTDIDALILAVAEINTRGGGTLVLEAGRTYTIDWQVYTSPVLEFSGLQGVNIVGNNAILKGAGDGINWATPNGARYMMDFNNCDGVTINQLRMIGIYNTFTTNPDHTNTAGEFGIHLWNDTLNVNIQNVYTKSLNTFLDVSDSTNIREANRVKNIILENIFMQDCRYGFLFINSGDNVKARNIISRNGARSVYITNVRDIDVQINSEGAHTSSDILISCQSDYRYTREENTIENIKIKYTSAGRWAGYTLFNQNYYDNLVTLQCNDVTAESTANPGLTPAAGHIINVDIDLNVRASTTSAQIVGMSKYYYQASTNNHVPDDSGVVRGHRIEGIRITGKVRDWAIATNPHPFNMCADYNSQNWAGDTVKGIVFENLVTENDGAIVGRLNGAGQGATDLRYHFNNCNIDGDFTEINMTGTQLPTYTSSIIGNNKNLGVKLGGSQEYDVVTNNGVTLRSQCAAWAKVRGSDGALLGGFNISSTQRNGAGDYTVGFNDDMTTINYSIAGAAVTNGVNGTHFERRTNIAFATTSVRISTLNATHVPADCTEFWIIVFGEKVL
jgi:hypothetical protein